MPRPKRRCARRFYRLGVPPLYQFGYLFQTLRQNLNILELPESIETNLLERIAQIENNIKEIYDLLREHNWSRNWLNCIRNCLSKLFRKLEKWATWARRLAQ